MTTTDATANCPECGANVTFSEAPMANEVVPCADCGADLEVSEISPLVLTLAPEIEEDWGE